MHGFSHCHPVTFKKMYQQKQKELLKQYEKQEKKLKELKAAGRSTKQAEKQTKEVLTRKQQKCRRKNQDEESQEPPELLKRPKEYTVRFTFPDPPPLSPPVLGLHGNFLLPVHPYTLPRPGIWGTWESYKWLLFLRCDVRL